MKPAGSRARNLPTRRGARRGAGARARGRGFILGYIMFALILLGVVVAAMSRMRDEQAGAEWVDRAQGTLRNNVQVIRTQVLLCAVTNSSDAAGLVTAMPQSDDDVNGDLLDSVQCPGAGNKLFDGTNTVFLPRPPQGFAAWRYVNAIGGGGPTDGQIFVFTSTSDPNGVAAINRLSKTFGVDEMAVSSASGTTRLTYFLRKPASAGGG